MKLIFILTLTIFSQILPAQISPELKSYNELINKAELAAVDSNYKLSIQYYEDAQKKHRPLFIKDRYNYAVLCAIEKRFDECSNQLYSILEKGGSINTFKRNLAFKGFFKSRIGKSLCKKAKLVKPSYNTRYRFQLDSLVRMDQYFRVKDGSYSIYGDTIKRIDSLNVISFLKLIAEYGFPSEELIGVDTAKFHRPIYELLILHNRTGARYRFFNFSTILIKAMESGEIETRTAIEYIEMSTGKYTCGIEEARMVKIVLDTISGSVCINKDAIKPDYSSIPIGFYPIENKMEEEYNTQRNQLGIDKVSESKIKAKFQFYNNRFDFGYGKLDILVCSSKIEYERMVSIIQYTTEK
jgi:hypothetical protein